jgi:4-hydroxybenzoyl-CoA thioesterase
MKAEKELQAGGETFRTDLQVLFEHCDAAGIVYYPRIFMMSAQVVERWFTSIGCDYWHLHIEREEGIPAVHAECSFLRPCKLAETLEFSLNVERLGTKSFTLSVRARGPGETGDRLRVRLILVWSHIIPVPKSREIPEKYRTQMARYLVLGQDKPGNGTAS